MNVNQKQKKWLSICLSAFLLIGIYPPWNYVVYPTLGMENVETIRIIRAAGYHLIFTSPSLDRKVLGTLFGNNGTGIFEVEIDLTCLAIHLVIMLIVAALGTLIFKTDDS